MRSVVVIAVAGLTLVGCGAAREVDDEILADAAAQTLDAGTSRVVLTIVDPGSITMKVQGEVDYRTPKAHALVDVTAPHDEGGNFSSEFILVRKALYTKVEHGERSLMNGKQWVELDVADGPGEMFGPFGKDPTDLLEFLRETSDVVYVGQAAVRGSTAQHYRGMLELDAVIEKFPAAARAELREELDRADPDLRRNGVPLEFWIDDEGFLRRVHVEVPRENKDPVAATVDFFDFGTRVEAKPPPADQVLSQDDMTPRLSPEQQKCLADAADERATDEEAFDEEALERAVARCLEQPAVLNGGGQ